MFERNDVRVKQERQARKEPLTEKDAKAMLAKVSQVVIARGKKTETVAAKDARPEMLKGPSGNFRAPMMIRGKKMLVGFSADTLSEWFD